MTGRSCKKIPTCGSRMAVTFPTTVRLLVSNSIKIAFLLLFLYETKEKKKIVSVYLFTCFLVFFLKRWVPGVPSSLNELILNDEENNGPMLRPFPSLSANTVASGGFAYV